MGSCLSTSTPPNEPNAPIKVEEEGVKVFTVDELKKATKDFGNKMEIGESLIGYIDPKTLSPAKEGVGMAVTVKRIYLTNKQSLQDWLVDQEFLRLNPHPSLVKLFGYGTDLGMLFIVSEYFPNGSLDRHICRESRPKSLPWETRLKISIGAAQCLAFLHSTKKVGLYGTYLTASKIMLGLEFNAKVSYLGLNILPPHDEEMHFFQAARPLTDLYEMAETDFFSHVTEPKQFHYAPPEYILSGMSHMAGDVYSFGVILLEMLTGFGKTRIIKAKRGIRNDKENIVEMIDPDLESNSYPLEAGRQMCKLIRKCLKEDPEKRPSMQQVLDKLNAIAQI
ncbi:probable serine/threonine-protein kinase CST [Capsella rubella]|nr:probable serine/threonine-protein kinase CST [Capsella rubella]